MRRRVALKVARNYLAKRSYRKSTIRAARKALRPFMRDEPFPGASTFARYVMLYLPPVPRFHLINV